MSCTCGCCDGVHAATPTDTYNPPQRDTIGYRIGTHGSFRESMQARLSSQEALSRLLTRDSDDPSIALLDCFAILGDILTFYQERIANEGYLRTASEADSLAQLGKLVGYRARPGLGADTYLAYTLDPGATALIPAGSGAKSVPRQNELPQTFETSEDLQAREEWNNLAPVMTGPPSIAYYRPTVTDNPDDVNDIPELHIAGTAANLKAGDRLLFLFDPAPAPTALAADFDPRFGTAVRIVSTSKPDFQAGNTAVSLISTRTRLSTALIVLENATNDAINQATTAVSVTTVISSYLDPLSRRLSENPPPTVDDILRNVLGAGLNASLPQVCEHLVEAAALASAHESPATRAWYTKYVNPMLDAARHVIQLAETALGRQPGEIDALRRRAHDILCPSDGKGHIPIFDDVDCDAGAALVSLTPMLPWLRRPPSQPPRKARDVDPGTLAWFRPDSDVHAKLLAAADPRVASALHQAWANGQVTPPPALSELQVLRVKVSVAFKEGDTVMLDTVYDSIVEGSWVVVGPTSQVRRVEKVEQMTRRVPIPVATPPGPGIAAAATPHIDVPATRLTLDTAVAGDLPAGTALYAQGENFTPVGDPITDDIAGDTIELGRVYDGLTPGRWVIVSGERTDVPYTSGIRAAELTMVAGVRQHIDPGKPASPVRTILKLTGELSYRYRRESVTVYGNVVSATQGETRKEILGGGDAGQPNQSFRIRQINQDNPLTALPASNPAGFDDELWVSVSGVRWRPTEVLATSAATDHVYRPVVGADDTVDIGFGDGIHGARPTGSQNIAATLRVGAGRDGNVVAGQISQLASQPLGVSAVTNPIAATGGTDGDTTDDARAVTPLRMLALDRLLSVRDYEDYTRARAGIAKASACRLFDGEQHVVHVTVASTGDAPVDAGSGLLTALKDSLAEFGDPGVTVRVDLRDMVLLVLRAGIKVKPDHTWDVVEPAVRAALSDTYSFARRDLVQDAYLSEGFAAAQAVPGIDYIDIDIFHGVPASVTPLELLSLADQLSGPDRVVRAQPAKYEAGQVFSWNESLTLTEAALHTGLTVEELCRLNPTLTDAPIEAYTPITIFRGIQPAEIVVLPPDVPEALMLRRIP